MNFLLVFRIVKSNRMLNVAYNKLDFGSGNIDDYWLNNIIREKQNGKYTDKINNKYEIELDMDADKFIKKSYIDDRDIVRTHVSSTERYGKQNAHFGMHYYPEKSTRHDTSRKIYDYLESKCRVHEYRSGERKLILQANSKKDIFGKK